MSLFKLAYSNFKRSIKNYVSLIISLSFSIFVFFNFQNIAFSGAMDVLKDRNSDYITTIIEVISIVFVIFVFFFIWYATNVFLAQRKKEIGIFTFMGLDNGKIGKMYVIEISLVALLSLIIGIGTGVIFSKLFTMILLALSNISVDVSFKLTLAPFIISISLFIVIFAIMIIKGYVNIVKSSVVEMLSASKQNELKVTNGILATIKAIIGMILLIAGYYCALQVGDLTSFMYILYAVVLVIVGIYFLYDGVIPFVIYKLIGNKKYLYQKQRTLWVNNIAFRLKKNYRTYAIVTILMICSVTVLATAFAMKERYDGIAHFRDTYNYTITASKQLDEKQIADEISKTNEVEFSNSYTMLSLNDEDVSSKYTYTANGIVSYSQLKQLAKKANIDFDLPELNDNQVIQLTRLYLIDISDPVSNPTITIKNQEYQIVDETNTSYLGILQENINTYVVNDNVYKQLQTTSNEINIYNYKIADPNNYQASIGYLDSLVESEGGAVGYVALDPLYSDIAWVRVTYSICIFLFIVFILASGSIIFMKVSNEAYEDRERYQILRKMGISNRVLSKSIKNEIRFAYYCPFVLMVITSYFSVQALANTMQTDLFIINVVSALIILVIFYLAYLLSVFAFKQKCLSVYL